MADSRTAGAAPPPAQPVSFPVFAAVAAAITGRGVYEVIELVGRIFEGAGAVFEGSPGAPGTLIALLPPSENAALLAVRLGLQAQRTEPTLRMGIDATEVRSKKEQDAKWQQVIDNAVRLQKAARTGEAIAGDAIGTLTRGVAATETVRVGDETLLLVTGVRDLSPAPAVPEGVSVAALRPHASTTAEHDPEPLRTEALVPEPSERDPWHAEGTDAAPDGWARSPDVTEEQPNDGWARPAEPRSVIDAPTPSDVEATSTEPAGAVPAETEPELATRSTRLEAPVLPPEVRTQPKVETGPDMVDEAEVVDAADAVVEPDRVDAADAVVEPDRVDAADAVVEPDLVDAADAVVEPDPRPRAAIVSGADVAASGFVTPAAAEPITPAGDAPPRSAALWDGKLIGRDAQLAELRSRFDRVVADRIGACVVIAGEPGIGRTRLVRELAASLDGVRLLSVACGGVRWPLAEIVETLAGIDPLAPASPARARLSELFTGEPDADDAVRHLASMIGVGDVGEPDRARWALRRLIEVATRGEPLLFRIDDTDRVGAGFPRFLADVAAAVRDTPILFALTTARETDAIATIRLGPLDDDEMAALTVELLGPVAPGVDATIGERLAGSPLALEQALALLTESGTLAPGQGRWTPMADLARVPFPETTSGSIRQRIQALPPHELIVLGMAAVAGERFDIEPLLDAVPGDARDSVPASLRDLVARGFLTAGPDTFIFRHPLLRAATLPLVPEWASSTTHERFARFSERRASDRSARHAEEIGAHLEGACRGRPEAPGQDRSDALNHLFEAANAALGHGDLDGASTLERLAATLVDDDERRAEIVYLAAEHAATANPERGADEQLAEAEAATENAGADVHRRIDLLRARLGAIDPHADALETARAVADDVIASGADEGPSWALANAWSLLGLVHARRAQNGSVADDLMRAADAAAAVGRPLEETAALRGAATALLEGPVPIDTAERRCASFLERVHGPLAEHDVAGAIALLRARRGDHDEARAAIANSVAVLEELGAAADLAVALHRAAEIELLAGQPAAADPLMRRAMAAAINARDDGLRARLAASFAQVLIADDDRLDEAMALADLAEAEGTDMATQVGWRMARGRVLARRGRSAQAERLAREGVGIAEQTDSTDLRANALIWAADIRRHAGRPAEAEPFERRALRLLQRTRSTAKSRLIAETLEPPTSDPSASTAVEPAPEPGEAAPTDVPAPMAGPGLADEMMTMFGPSSEPSPVNEPTVEPEQVPSGRPVAEMQPEDELLDDPTRSAHDESHRRWFNR
jgi:hypothetical protein